MSAEEIGPAVRAGRSGRAGPTGPIRPLDRLMGTEMEYVIHAAPERTSPAPTTDRGNAAACHAVLEALAEAVPSLPGVGLFSLIRRQRFFAHGGSAYFEAQPEAPNHGLVEVATPECRGPDALLLAARARDHLVQHATARAAEKLGTTLHARANGADARGSCYGPQESYDAPFASGRRLWAWRAIAAIHVPMSLFIALPLFLTATFVLFVVAILAATIAAVVQGMQRTRPVPERDLSEAAIDAVFDRIGVPFVSALTILTTFTISASAHLLGWRPLRDRTTAFFITRQVYSGAGRLTSEGALHLSEKAHRIDCVTRAWHGASARGIFETGHMAKAMLSPPFATLAEIRGALAPRQRLQLGFADALTCDDAAWLAWGASSLVLDLAEAGELDDAPRVRDPVAALKQISSGGIHTRVPCSDGVRRSAIELQRWYLDRAARWLADRAVDHADAHEAEGVVRVWRQTLDALQHDPIQLVGRVDWITKAALLEASGPSLTGDQKKKIDLKFHELGSGYAAWLRQAGVIRARFAPEVVARAAEAPPADTPAADRGRLIAAWRDDRTARATWTHVVRGPPKDRITCTFRPRGGDAHDLPTASSAPLPGR